MKKYKMVKGMRIMGIVFVVLLVVLGGILIYWNISVSPNSIRFKKNIQTRINKTEEANAIYTKAEIEELPEAMERYFKYINCEGKEKHNVVNVLFKDAYFFMSGKELSIDYDLWLFSDKPYRAACITSSLYGIPFEGMDYSDDVKRIGGMKGVIGKAIPIFHVNNNQIYTAGLISWIIEGVVNPSILLSPYITYNQLDYNHVEAVVSYNGTLGKGTLTIDNEGKITSFESWERQVEKIDGVDTYLGWRCDISDYKNLNGMNIPFKLSATTIYPGREQLYFKSNYVEISYFK